jgi:hypothetical protein|tara:strand:+ start:176 stop:418 length:243 start_codon:yes stop_codon:yes gene_type:complete
MNRKFVKENKQVIREFIGKLLVNILTKKNKRALDKVIAADPTLKGKKEDMLRLRKSIESRIEKLDKSNPELIANLRKAYL